MPQISKEAIGIVTKGIILQEAYITHGPLIAIDAVFNFKQFAATL